MQAAKAKAPTALALGMRRGAERVRSTEPLGEPKAARPRLQAGERPNLDAIKPSKGYLSR